MNGHEGLSISAKPAAGMDYSVENLVLDKVSNPPELLFMADDVPNQSAKNGDEYNQDSSPAYNSSQRQPSHMESGLEKYDSSATMGWSKLCFCWGRYEAPEARPWVFMHVVVGICVIHFSIAISQAILYTASTVADANQRMPNLFYIRAGNTQIAVNIIVSIINFAMLPTIGAISDYTRFRYHVGCAAILAVCAAEFVSAAASQELFGLMMGTAVVFGLCFQIWYMCLRIAYITEMSSTKEGTVHVTSDGYSMLFFSELIFMLFALATTLYLSVPNPTPAQNLQMALSLARISGIAAGIVCLPFAFYTIYGLKPRPAVIKVPPGRSLVIEAVSTYWRKMREMATTYRQLGALLICYASTNAVQAGVVSILNTYMIYELRFVQLYVVVVVIVALFIAMLGVMLSHAIMRCISLRLFLIINMISFGTSLIIAPFCLIPQPCIIRAPTNITAAIRMTAAASIKAGAISIPCPARFNATCSGKCPPEVLLGLVMERGSGADEGFMLLRTGPSLAAAVGVACVFGSWWGVSIGWTININIALFARFCPGGRETEYAGMLTLVFAAMYEVMGVMRYNLIAVAAMLVIPMLLAVFFMDEEKAKAEIADTL
eukprot:CAMPEP_0172195956 /NCGR_PEP_ID=MMETSP1050-20130122/26519_1 /TAXON_ID=233186 /ORGANISM="Cryptomonas curvata, Strain CCAP979/52" /LENGTH=602 /DNA_ID=CAMNT_0012872123 /DNA_START=49 /DNA_END=1854 /DNA_ORIENTATION=-